MGSETKIHLPQSTTRVEIDGSTGEGGGQILRTSMTLASIFRIPIRVSNIRARRREPGLRPQHLQAVQAAAKLTNGSLNGASVGSTEIKYFPGELLEDYRGSIDTGTAGSVSLIAQTIVPISIFGGTHLDVRIVGGTEVPNSPTVDYLQQLLLPVYRSLGAHVEIMIERRGYYPRGGGIVRITSAPGQSKPSPLSFAETERRAEKQEVNILSVSRSLPEHISSRQSASARSLLEKEGFARTVQRLDSSGPSLSPGSSMLVYIQTGNTMIGSSSLGERGKRAELVGEEAAINFLNECSDLPNVDSHLADMLVTLACLINGTSRFTTSRISDHFTTNSEIAKKIVGCSVSCKKIDGRWQVSVAGSSEKPN